MGSKDEGASRVPKWTAKPKRLGELVLSERAITSGSLGRAREPDPEGISAIFEASCPAAARTNRDVQETLQLAALITKTFADMREPGLPTRFLEICCGRGRLTHALNASGKFRGRGADRTKRPQWILYPGDPDGTFFEATIGEDSRFLDVDLIVALRPHDVTLLIPRIASQSGCDFLLVPCCFVDHDGKTVDSGAGVDPFASYFDVLAREGANWGYHVTSRQVSLPADEALLVLIGRRATTFK